MHFQGRTLNRIPFTWLLFCPSISPAFPPTRPWFHQWSLCPRTSSRVIMRDFWTLVTLVNYWPLDLENLSKTQVHCCEVDFDALDKEPELIHYCLLASRMMKLLALFCSLCIGYELEEFFSEKQQFIYDPRWGFSPGRYRKLAHKLSKGGNISQHIAEFKELAKNPKTFPIVFLNCHWKAWSQSRE